MTILTLHRLSSDKDGVYGVFIFNKRPICHSYELPWLANLRTASCIPPGTYTTIKTNSPKFAKCFYLKEVPGRDGILIHPGNTRHDTQGCILPGLDVSERGVIHSRLALDRLYAILPHSFDLDVRS